MDSPRTFQQVLDAALADGGVGARERLAAIAREADELEFIYAAYVALASWGEAGVRDILDNAAAGHTVKCKSAALTLFAALSATGHVPHLTMVLVAQSTRATVNARLMQIDARALGRRALRELVMLTATDDLLVPISQSFMHLALQTHGEEAMGQALVTALSSKWLNLSAAVLDAYERMLTAQAENEREFQQFFCRYPQLLDPMAIEVWSEPDFHGALAPDFLLRRADDTYLVVEIETPAKPIMTQKNQISAATLQAAKQAMDYGRFLSDRVQEARTHFPGFNRAERLVVIGLESGLKAAQRDGLRMENEGRHDLQIVGFDWLLQRARIVIDNISDGGVVVHKGHRLI